MKYKYTFSKSNTIILFPKWFVSWYSLTQSLQVKKCTYLRCLSPSSCAYFLRLSYNSSVSGLRKEVSLWSQTPYKHFVQNVNEILRAVDMIMKEVWLLAVCYISYRRCFLYIKFSFVYHINLISLLKQVSCNNSSIFLY